MKKLNTAIYLFFFICTLADFITSLMGIQKGYAEQNPIYSIIGSQPFWALYIILNLGLLALLIKATQKWWWAKFILIIPISAHAICAIHNLGVIA